MAHEPLDKGEISEPADRDLRYPLLVIIALMLLLAQWTGLFQPKWQTTGKGASSSESFIPMWLTGSLTEEGLYLLPADRFAPGHGMAELYEDFGLTVPIEGLGKEIDLTNVPVGLFLEDGQPPRPTEVPAGIYPLLFRPLPINRSTADEIAMLPGIGPSLAARIVAARETRGGFTNERDLLAVQGIGYKKLHRLRNMISME